MRVKRGYLKELSRKTGIAVTALSDYANARKRPGGNRSFFLESMTGVPAQIWLAGTAGQIKKQLNGKAKEL